MEFNCNFNSYDRRSEVDREIRKLTLFLYAMGNLTREDVGIIIKTMENLLRQLFIPFVLKDMEVDNIQSSMTPETFGRIKMTLEDASSIFDKYSSEHKRFKAYEQDSLFTYPQELKIGEKLEEPVNKSTGLHVPIKTVHVSMHRTLKILFEMPNIYNETISYMKELSADNKIISNIIQGNLWKNNYRQKDKTILPILLFFDDFETGNPLGSHAGNQKLGGVYASLPSLPPYLVRKMKTCFLVSLFHSEDRIRCTNEITFKKVIDELNELSINGLEIYVNGQKKHVYFQCVLILGDNLGLNSCCGLVESFNAINYCRICRATSEQCKTMVLEDIRLLRNVANYEKDLEYLLCGVKEKCVFNRLSGFHITKNKALDIMHDIFEGMAVYVVEKVLHSLIQTDKIITLEAINERIGNFNYGNLEASNKPRPLTMDRSRDAISDCAMSVRVKQSASEMACLVRYLGLMIGDLIPPENKHWKLYRIFRKIVGTVTSPSVIKTEIEILKDNIKDHNRLFVELYGSLPPKGHFIIHIPRLILENGPMIHLWSMPYERKNKEMKDIATATSSSRNILVTIAIRNQLNLAYLKEFNYEIKKFLYGPSSELPELELVNILPAMTGYTYGKKFNYLTIHRIKYSLGDIVIISVNNGQVFIKLHAIYELKGYVYFFGYKYPTIVFDTYYHAYQVQVSQEESVLVNINMVPKMYPGLLIIKGEKYFVSVRHD